MTQNITEPGFLVANRYRLVSLIGQGGMGKIFSAMDEKLERTVAIKLLQAKFSRRKDADARFRREAQIGAQLHHKHIVQIYDFGKDGETLYLVMELLKGCDLANYLLKHKRVDAQSTIQLGLQISDAMTEAHRLQLVHRDIKPENIFLISQSPLSCKIVDFGMAMTVEGAMDMQRLTAKGLVAGTPLYMAPEQLCGQQPQRASDVYSLACVLFQLLTGTTPYSHPSLGDLAAHHLYAPIPEIPAEFTDVPLVLREMLRRCLSKNASQRPSMLQIRDRLQAILEARDEKALAEIQFEAAPEAQSSNSEAAGSRIAFRGSFSPEISLAVAAAGMTIISEEDIAGGDALVSIGEATETLAQLKNAEYYIIADSQLSDMQRISSLLRLGVQEVVARPVRSDDLVQKIRRAFRSKRKPTRAKLK